MAASDEPTSSSLASVSSSTSTKRARNRSRSKSTSPPISISTSAFSLRFIDETQRQTSSQIRRDIRSHVRKGSHERQRRLNAAAKARPLEGARKLLQKASEGSESQSRSQSQSPSRAKLVPALKKLQISIPAHEDVDHFAIDAEPSSGEGSGSNTSLEIEKAIVHIPWRSPLDVGSGIEVDGMLSSGDSTPEAQAPMDRWDFETTTPYALMLGKDGPILQMRARNWPFQRIFGKQPGVSVWMPCSVIPLPKVGPRPYLLRDSKVVPWICNSPEYFSFKEETIRWVNKRLDDDPTHEKTIGGIACLMSWEIARGNTEETALHMDGLVRIVTMKGGLKRLCPIKQFCWKIHLIDLVVAVTTNSHPRFWDQNPQRPGKYTNHSHQISDSPLHGTQRFSSSTFSLLDFCPATLTLLQEMRDLTEGVKATLSREIGRGTVFEIVNAAASIYRRAFLGVPFEASCNARDVQRMCELLEDETCDETWVRYPGVLMWILLVGIAAGRRSRERSFLTMFFYRVGTTAVWWGMEECTEAVMTFLRVKRGAEV
ncbi:hypothetical protein IFR05_009092 [Cadophora sp. M221]|nr:hypothetical protein IFR05_009092 [Cadophora sp. M221]